MSAYHSAYVCYGVKVDVDAYAGDVLDSLEELLGSDDALSRLPDVEYLLAGAYDESNLYLIAYGVTIGYEMSEMPVWDADTYANRRAQLDEALRRMGWTGKASAPVWFAVRDCS